MIITLHHKRQVFTILIILTFWFGCFHVAHAENSTPFSFSSWVTYWDYHNSVDEAIAYEAELASISVFAANLRADNGSLAVPENFLDSVAVIHETYDDSHDWYVSVVNDVLLNNGSYLQKDTNILRQLLSDETSMMRHIDELISFCCILGADGIEIDYEAIGKDENLWNDFHHFISSLYQRTKEAGVKLRVILGPSDLGFFPLVEGPEYMVMCYNLYGGHSGPGPKADDAFLGKIFDQMSALPDSKIAAFSNGGFDWRSDGSISSITQTEAERMLADYPDQNIEVLRDPASNVLHFTFSDGWLDHEIWYADENTILAWMEQAAEAGIHKIALWRLGGNNKTSMDIIFSGKSVE